MHRLTGIIRGPINAEDLEPIPGTTWVLTSGMMGPTATRGHLYAVDRETHSCRQVFPYDADLALDEQTYGHSELDIAEFEPHGLDVAVGPDGRIVAYVVNHGGRESVEVFDVDVAGAVPRLTWVGSLTLPSGLWGNDVAALPGGGFVVSSSFDISESAEAGFAASAAGEPTGTAAEWTPTGGWKHLVGSEINSANGVAVSADGAWVYIAGWASKCLRKFPRTPGAGEPVEVPCDVMIDNITWSEDGRSLLATGAYDTSVADFATEFYGTSPFVRCPTKVWRFDAETLEAELVAEYGIDEFTVATTAVEVGDEIWLGSMRAEGIGRLARD